MKTITKYQQHWNVISKNLLSGLIIHLIFWILIRAKLIKAGPGWREQWRSRGAFFVCCLCYHSRCQRVEEGAGEKKKRERNADSWKECVNRRISLFAGLVCPVRQSVCCRCCAPSVPATLAQHHWHFPITVSARLGAASFPVRVITDRIENARNVANFPASSPKHLHLVGGPRCWLKCNRILFRGHKILRSVVEVFRSPHTRSLPGQSEPCSHIFLAGLGKNGPMDWVGTSGKASQHTANPSHSSSRLSATIFHSGWSEVFTKMKKLWQREKNLKMTRLPRVEIERGWKDEQITETHFYIGWCISILRVLTKHAHTMMAHVAACWAIQYNLSAWYLQESRAQFGGFVLNFCSLWLRRLIS